jgi:hypothetical protein
MRLVYTAGSEKSLPAPPVPKETKPNTRRTFFSSLLSNFSSLQTPSRTISLLPTVPVEEVDPLIVYQTNMELSIFSADVNVRLDKRLAAELHRSTKKNPPSRMRYELIYVSEEYPCACWGLQTHSSGFCRLARMNTMRAQMWTRTICLQPEAYSKAFVRTLMGEPRS